MPAGGILLLDKSVLRRGGRIAYGVARAAHPGGPYQHLTEGPLAFGSATASYEDAVVWREDGLYQMLFNDMEGGRLHRRGPCRRPRLVR